MLNRSLVSVVRLKRHKGITVHIVSNFVEEDYPTPPQNSADLFLKPEMMCLVHSVHIFLSRCPSRQVCAHGEVNINIAFLQLNYLALEPFTDSIKDPYGGLLLQIGILIHPGTIRCYLPFINKMGTHKENQIILNL